MVVIAEALVQQDRWPNHGTYNLVRNSKYMSGYVRKDRDIRVKSKDEGEWVLIGGNIAVVYLPLHKNPHEVGRILRGISREAETIIGDLNCCGRSKKRVLEAWIEEEELQDIAREEHTHEWGRHMCRIDRVLPKGRQTMIHGGGIGVWE